MVPAIWRISQGAERGKKQKGRELSTTVAVGHRGAQPDTEGTTAMLWYYWLKSLSTICCQNSFTGRRLDSSLNEILPDFCIIMWIMHFLSFFFGQYCQIDAQYEQGCDRKRLQIHVLFHLTFKSIFCVKIPKYWECWRSVLAYKSYSTKSRKKSVWYISWWRNHTIIVTSTKRRSLCFCQHLSVCLLAR